MLQKDKNSWAKGSGARMQDIVDAGANKALVHYYYYKSKENLFRIIFFEAEKN